MEERHGAVPLSRHPPRHRHGCWPLVPAGARLAGPGRAPEAVLRGRDPPSGLCPSRRGQGRGEGIPPHRARLLHPAELYRDAGTLSGAGRRPDGDSLQAELDGGHPRAGGDPLTLVSEMPLFITPGVGETLGPPDPVGEEWKERRGRWQGALSGGRVDSAGERAAVLAEMSASGLTPMPILDQMSLQWRLVSAGLEQVRLDRDSKGS